MEEAGDKKPAAEHRATQQQKTKLQGPKLSTHEAILFAEKEGKINEVLDENQSQQWGGTGTTAQDAIIINSQSPIADIKKRITPLVTRAMQMFTFLMNK